MEELPKRVKHYATKDIHKMSTYQKWRLILGAIQICIAMLIPWVTRWLMKNW
jgi:hypothetical protein